MPRSTKLINNPTELFDGLREEYGGLRNVLTATWSLDVKRGLADDLKRVISELEAAIKDAQARKNDDEANAWRAAQVFLNSIEAELRMWLCIAERNASAAWDWFVTAELQGKQVAGWLQDFGPARAHVEHLECVERVLFPKLMFLSSSFIVSQADQFCTLCDHVYGTCDHIAGELYSGEIAGRETRNIQAVREVSIVERPSSKRCRVLNIDGIDPLTGEPVQQRHLANEHGGDVNSTNE